jgi:hypothetical protein
MFFASAAATTKAIRRCAGVSEAAMFVNKHDTRAAQGTEQKNTREHQPLAAYPGKEANAFLSPSFLRPLRRHVAFRRCARRIHLLHVRRFGIFSACASAASFMVFSHPPREHPGLRGRSAL